MPGKALFLKFFLVENALPMSKRIILLTQWFEPEPAFKGLLFAKELVKKGFIVEVITGFPNYPGGVIYPGYRIKLIQKEVIDGVLITRVPLFPSHGKSKIGRIFNYLSFAMTSLIYGLFFAKRPDLIYVYHPPLTVGLSAVLIKIFRRVPVVYDIQDMWPDTLKATGMVNNKIILSLISKICSFVYDRADKIVVLSPGFKRCLINRGVKDEKIDVIYNWTDEILLRDNRNKTPNSLFKKDSFNILFAGNVGRAQGLDVVLDAAVILKKDCPKLCFLILGQGLMLDDLKTRTKDLKLDNVVFIPAVSMSKAGSFLKSADALLVHLNKDPLFAITIPGKTQAYMAMGKPIIMAVPGDASDLIVKANCGICIEPGSAVSLAEAAKKLMNLENLELQILGANAASFYDKNLSVKVGVNSFSKIFTKVVHNYNI